LCIWRDHRLCSRSTLRALRVSLNFTRHCQVLCTLGLVGLLANALAFYLEGLNYHKAEVTPADYASVDVILPTLAFALWGLSGQ
jgi:uncharacterized membrane protein